MLNKNDEIVLEIEDMTNEGSAIGHYDGMAVFVRGAVTGDTVLAHIIKSKKSYAVGIVKEIISASKKRIESDCPASDKCGGCSFRNMTYEAELDYKQNRVADVIKRIGGIDVCISSIIGATNTLHYRNKAQYPVFINDGNMYAGFYAYKSHRIIPCNDCKLQDEEFSSIVKSIEAWVKESDVSSYDERINKGLLRHIYLRKAVATNEVMVCLVINGNKLPNQELLIELLTENKSIKSICVNINKADTNVVLGNETNVIYGSDTITDILLGNKFIISPQSFYQVNHDQCEKLYLKAIEYAELTGEQTVVDLYCGAGTIGLSMANNAKKIYGVEIIPQAIENAKINAHNNGITNAEFFCGDAYEATKMLQNDGVVPDVLVLDPPRKGCQKELFDTIEQMAPKKIVYVSCDPATLARDLAILNDKGYKTTAVTPVDMFPRTPHVETVVLMSRKEK